MLVLTRKTQEQIQIGNNIKITILQVKGQAVRLGIEAPRDVRVLRSELQAIEVEVVTQPEDEGEPEHEPTRAGVLRNPPAFERREEFSPLTSPVRTGKAGLAPYLGRRRTQAVRMM